MDGPYILAGELATIYAVMMKALNQAAHRSAGILPHDWCLLSPHATDFS